MADETPTPSRVDTSAAADDAAPLAPLQLDRARLPVCDLAEFNAADVRRVSSFTTNFGSWQAPREVARALGMPDAGAVELEWIHDTGELVLLGGVPRVDDVSVEVPRSAAAAGAVMPAFLGGTVGAAGLDQGGSVRELFKSEVMPPGTRVAVLAHIKHGPKAHELLWGWHREHRRSDGWEWLVDRLAKLEQEPPGSDDHLG